MKDNREKKTYPNLFLAIKDRDRLWFQKGRRLRAYRCPDGSYCLTSMNEDVFFRNEINESVQKNYTEKNLISFIYRFLKKYHKYPELKDARAFFDASEELIESFVSDCKVVLIGQALVPLSEIEEICQVKISDVELKREIIIVREFPLDDTHTIDPRIELSWEIYESSRGKDAVKGGNEINLAPIIYLLIIFAAGFFLGQIL